MITKRKINSVLKGYNKYRSSFAEASLIGKKRNVIFMRFSGNFCYSCGFYDYFDDLRIELERETGQRIELREVKERPDGDYTAIFSVKPLVG